MTGEAAKTPGSGNPTRSNLRPGLLATLGNVAWTVEQAIEDLLVGWTPNKIPDLSGKVALVTGGNSGIGLEVVRKLAQNCAHVLMVSRDKERGEAAAEEVRSSLGMSSASSLAPGSQARGRIEVLQCDLADLKAVEGLVKEVKRRTKTTGLSMLLCNAALFQPGAFATSPDGLEVTLAVDYYAHVVLTLGLLDELKAAAPSRVVLQSSQAEQFGAVDLANLKGDKFTDSGMTPYGCAKLWMLMFAEELQRRLRAEGGKAAQIDVFGVHPGLVDSPLMDKADTKRHFNAALIMLQNAVLGMPTWRGSLPALFALTEPRLQGRGFAYIGPNWFNTHMLGFRQPGNTIWRVGGPELRGRLFNETASLLKSLGHKPDHLPKAVTAA